MSRHRTTMKMHRASDKPSESRPAETAGEDTGSTAQPEHDVPNEPAAQGEALTMETLGRYLDREVSEREASEERTSTLLARYFKLTLVMAALNMLVAGTSVAMLFKHPDSPQPIVVAAPASQVAPVVAPPSQPVERAPLESPPATPIAAPAPLPVPPSAASSPAKIPLLGQPLLPAVKRAPVSYPARMPRVASKPSPTTLRATSLPSSPVVFARSTDEDRRSEASTMAERW
jgi:hypothetical protein